MTPEEMSTMQDIVSGLMKGDKPFMALFCLLMMFLIYMATKVMTYVMDVKNSHDSQVKLLTQNIREQRKDYTNMIAEERSRSDKREKELFRNLDKNTEQLQNIADTLKEVQFKITSVEHKVAENYDFLVAEINNMKKREQ